MQLNINIINNMNIELRIHFIRFMLETYWHTLIFTWNIFNEMTLLQKYWLYVGIFFAVNAGILEILVLH